MPSEHADRSTHTLRVTTIAGELIAEHGLNAVHVAIGRLNDALDRRDRVARDFWAEVVHAIVEQKRCN